jgi:hypothetical protein
MVSLVAFVFDSVFDYGRPRPFRVWVANEKAAQAAFHHSAIRNFSRFFSFPSGAVNSNPGMPLGGRKLLDLSRECL